MAQRQTRSVFAYATHITQVPVDTEVGHIQVEEVWVAHDVGKVIKLRGIEGQIDGGIVTGVGYALMEEQQLKNRHLLITHLAEYMAPLVYKIPEIE